MITVVKGGQLDAARPRRHERRKFIDSGRNDNRTLNCDERQNMEPLVERATRQVTTYHTSSYFASSEGEESLK